MRRLHLVELEDLEWFPAVVRDGGTAFLRAAERVLRVGSIFSGPLADAMRRTGHTEIVDLCSGGAGPLPEVIADLRAAGLNVSGVMTDKFPNVAAFSEAITDSDGQIRFEAESVDATDVPKHLTGFRTIFNAFHHFPPELARGILADAVAKRTPIGVFEIVERTPQAVMGVLSTPLGVLALMPTIRPVRPAWWFLTYVLPAIPALVAWDGFVSCLRVYSPEELREMIDSIDGHETFDWKIERVKIPPGVMRATILIGTPRAN